VADLEPWAQKTGVYMAGKREREAAVLLLSGHLIVGVELFIGSDSLSLERRIKTSHLRAAFKSASTMR
jgi:hypothetical protein